MLQPTLVTEVEVLKGGCALIWYLCISYFEVECYLYWFSNTSFLALNKLFRVLDRIVFSLFLRHSQIHVSFKIM